METEKPLDVVIYAFWMLTLSENIRYYINLIPKYEDSEFNNFVVFFFFLNGTQYKTEIQGTLKTKPEPTT